MRHQPVDGTEHSGLSGAGAADDQAQLALVDAQVNPGQHRPAGVGVGDGDVAELDHETGSTVRAASCVGTLTLADEVGTGGGASQAGSAATRMPAVATSGSVGHARGDSEG
jgi:hypothetical protein